jgi:predicted house-cleaning noncanonical NTP pyrophosphatase (MazG superfamily)
MGTDNSPEGGIAMSVAAFDRLKGYMSSRLLEKIVQTSTSGDEGKLAELFELLSRLAPAR